jgi:hypothetical protein
MGRRLEQVARGLWEERWRRNAPVGATDGEAMARNAARRTVGVWGMATSERPDAQDRP